MTRTPLRIDVEAVVAQRVPAKYRRWIPRAVIGGLERFIRQDQLNDILRHTNGLTGAAFCRSVLEYLDVEYDVDGGVAALPDDKRVMFVSNHPLGALDGIIIIDMLARRYGSDELYFVVNDLLNAVSPLADIFVPVNKHGSQSRESAVCLDRAMSGNGPVIVFPAGLVSRQDRSGHIADPEWNKMFVNKAVQYRRDIIPLYFEGRNSDFFYRMARLRKSLGIGFNYEMMRLPAEIFNSRGCRYTVRTGCRIPHDTLDHGAKASAQAKRIRETLYNLSKL